MQHSTRLSDIFPLPVESSRLNIFIGDWLVEGNLVYMGRPFKAKGTAKFSLAAAGWGILATAKLQIENLGAYEEVDLLSFNRAEKLFHFFAVTNTGASYDHKGKWKDDKTLNFSYEVMQGEKSYKEELEIKVISENQLAINEKDFLEEQVITTLDVVLNKLQKN
jgi:hypothetical protein